MEENDISCEPMDIDLSSQSVKQMDISYNDFDVDEKPFSRPTPRNSVSNVVDQPPSRSSTSGQQPIVKKYHIQKPPRSSKNRLFKILTAFIAAFIATITYHVYGLNCCDQLNLKLLNETLSNKVFGQSAAVQLIIQSLEFNGKTKLLFLYGGTGVGKTFTSSLLLDSIDSCSNVYHYTMPSFIKTFSTDLMFGLVMCKTSIMIVDDLTLNDMDIKIHIQDVIKKSENFENDITVILIYNCKQDHTSSDSGCDKSIKTKILNNFSEIKALKSFIMFEPLSEKHLRECINQELGYKKLNDWEFNTLLKNFNVTVDGCKGVHSKMKYLNIV